jgi:acyl-CoA synthetase (AMP-forming)/AMP-acid ligase II
MTEWNLADVFETVAARLPEAPALAQGDRSQTWSETNRRANGVARALLDAGIGEQDKFAQYLHNCPEYVESTIAAFKAGMATVNTNYRYVDDELVYLWDNADAVAVVFHAAFAPNCARVRHLLPAIRLWIWVDDGSRRCPEWATPYEEIAAGGGDDNVSGPWGRSGDHLMLLYTGGTTGMPKGVMWRQDDVFRALDANNRVPMTDHAALEARLVKPGPRNLPGAPLMHGTGFFNVVSNLMVGGSVTMLVGRRFDPVELLDTIEARRINSMSIVGDAFARPIVKKLDEEPERWDISSLRVVVSSGVMWSAESKAALLRHNPRLILVDSLGSSEGIGMANSTTRADGSTATARFELSANTRVLTDDGRDVMPGSGEVGQVAMRGHTAIGYYKDPQKSAATFRVVDGQRYSIPGDWAEVLADGTLKLLGRGSQCINTGGEKVYPEEVEEVLKLYPGVHDAAVVGLPHERFGQAITALVEADDGLDTTAMIAFVKTKLAAYKAPKDVFVVDSVGRAVNGKLDYKAATAHAIELATTDVETGGSPAATL